MSLRFVCVHGHHLELTSNSAPPRVVCPVCGCVNDLDLPPRPDKSGSREVTQDLPDSREWLVNDESKSQARDTPTGFYDETVGQVAESSSGSISPTLPSDGIRAPEEADAEGDDAGLATPQRASRDAISVGGAAEETQDEQFTPPELDGYEVLGELGRGGMGVVYRAYEKQHGRHVALKTLQRMSPVELQHFKQEFRALADVAHPNLASLYSLLSDGKTWCFTMELLEGVDCMSYVWSGFKSSDRTSSTSDQRLSGSQLQRLLDVLRQLVVGLHALHGAGMLHRDVKPSNVMITSDGGLKLLDFGLSAEMERDASTSRPRRIQGTPEYMAPEQAGCTKISEASDWYAVGVVLYEMLTGQLPIQGTPIKILLNKQRRTPREPREIEPSTPQHLNDLCMKLLDRDPRRRPTAADVLRCIGADDLAEGLRDARVGAEQTVEIVGRERHLATLRDHFNEVAGGKTISLFVHGRSGMGKSVLVRKFLDEVKQSAVILEGRCYEQESVPFKALDSLIDSLAVCLDGMSPDTTRKLQPDDSLPLTRLFPVLGQVLEADPKTAPSIETADQQELRQRASDGLRELLTRLGEQQSLVLYVDDLQWGDIDSAGLLADLVRPPNAPRLLLLGSYRSEEVDTSASLQALIEAYSRGHDRPRREELAVESLLHEDSKRLAMMLLGGDDKATERYADRIACESGGWPFFVWELAQHVQDQPSNEEGSLVLDEVIWSRVGRLPEETRRLLELFAVAGRPMPAPQAYEAIERVSQGPGLLAQLRASNFVRITEAADEPLVETYHDRIRESVVNHLPKNMVREKNLMLALAIERSSGVKVDDLEKHLVATPDYDEPTAPYELTKQQWQRIFDLSSFFAAAGKIERAFPYALAAAEKAWSQNALDVAEHQYQIAANGSASSDDPVRFRVAEGLGEVLLTRGRYDEALDQLQTARSLAHGHVPSARVDGKLGFVAFKKGDMPGAQAHFEDGLRELGNPTPSNNVTQTMALLKEGLTQIFHTYFPSRFRGRRRPDTEQSQMDLLRARLYDGLGYPYWFKKGPVPTLWTHLRHMNLAERYPPTQELGRAYAMHGVMMTAIPLAQRGASYADRSYHIHGEQGDLQGQGKARSFQTFSLLALGRFKEGAETGREAVHLLEQAGDVWEANMARLIWSQPLYFLGDLEASYRTVKQAVETGKETGDHSAVAIAALFWPPCAPGTMPPEIIQEEIERERDDPLSESAAIQGYGLELLLHEDKPKEAAKVIQDSLDVAKRRGLRNPCIFCGLAWKATALRTVAEREPDGPSRREALDAAKVATRDALKITKSYLSCRSQALREAALLQVLEEHPDRARKFFDDSMRVAEQQQAAYEYAKTLVARGEAGLRFDWESADEQFADGRAQVAAIEGFEK